MAHNPKQRPSLLEWCSYSAAPFSDVGMPLQERSRGLNGTQLKSTMKNTNPSNVKKQRLDRSGQYNTSGFRGRYGPGMTVVH